MYIYLYLYYLNNTNSKSSKLNYPYTPHLQIIPKLRNYPSLTHPHQLLLSLQLHQFAPFAKDATFPSPVSLHISNQHISPLPKNTPLKMLVVLLLTYNVCFPHPIPPSYHQHQTSLDAFPPLQNVSSLCQPL